MTIYVCIVLVVVVVALVFLRNKKKKAKAIPAEDSGKKIELDETTSSSVRMGKEFMQKKDTTKEEGNHTITTLYESQEDNFVWVCPNCEVENPASKKKCCVCHYVK